MQTVRLEDNILLWGAHASGKSTLISAFIRELSNLNASGYHDFAYRVVDGATNMPIFADITKPLPTQDLIDSLVSIQRYPKTEKGKNYQASYQFQHKITIRDTKGMDTINWGREGNIGFDVSADRFSNFIAVLDPTALKSERESMLDDLIRFFSRLSLKNIKKKYLAICITKVDRLKTAHQKPESLFNEYFDNYVDAIRAMLNENIEVQFFATSALGYYFEDSKRHPNYSDQHGWLANNTWKPEKVVLPFFWIFTCIERKYLLETKTISYWMSSMLKGLRPKASYIPWPGESDDINDQSDI